MDRAAVRSVQQMQAVIDPQKRETPIIASQTQFLRFGGGTLAIGIVPGKNDAMQAVKRLIPGAISQLGHQDRFGLGRREASHDTRRPQTAAMSFVALDVILPEDADANGWSAT